MDIQKVVLMQSDPVLVALAHRYCYYVIKEQCVSDAEYDRIEEEAVAGAAPDSAIHKPGSSNPDDYPYEIKCLAQFFLNRKRGKEVGRENG